MEQSETGQGPTVKQYEPPPWSGVPKDLGSCVEVIKGGQITETIALVDKAFFIFGRQAKADVVTEHPSLSRQHCVLQFGNSSEYPFLCDLGSTHGTFINKKKLNAFDYTQLRDGDVFQLGFSTRLYHYNHSKEEAQSPHTPAAMERQDFSNPETKRKKRSKYSVTWGIQDDAPVETEVTEIEWKEYAETHALTQKQQKIADRIRKLERRKEKLELECKRIHEKEEKFEELTPGQIAALLSNEKTMERVSKELEELENSIQTSILEKLNPSVAKARIEAKRDLEDSDDGNDAFYDRSRKDLKKNKKEGSDDISIDALINERDALEKRQEYLQLSIDAQIKEANEDEDDGDDALDAFMMNLDADERRRQKQAYTTEFEGNGKRLIEIEKLLKWIDPDSFYSKSRKTTQQIARHRL